jgi:PAS domain S-box-containing protein
MDALSSLDMDEKIKLVTLTVLTILCILLEIILHLYLGVSTGYTHFFYILLVLAAIWYQRKAVLLALCLAVTHILIAVFEFNEPLWVPLLRASMFVLVTLLVAIISEDLKKAEVTVKENEARFRAIYEGSNDAIMLLNEKGFFDCNPHALQMFGVTTKEDFCRLHPADLSPPSQPGGIDSVTASNEHIHAAFQNGCDRFEWVHRRTNGEDFPAEVLLSAFDWGKDRVLQATVRDITERKRLEELLLEEKNQWKATFDSIPDLLAIIDSRHRVVQVNKAMADKLAVSPDAARGIFCYPAVHGTTAPPEYCPHNLLLKDKKTHTTDEFLPLLNGYYSITTSPLFNPDGSIFGSVHLAHDITERKRHEEEWEKIRSWHGGVNQILESMLAPIPIEKKLQVITDGIVATFGADFCRIWLIEKGDRCSIGCIHADTTQGPPACRNHERCLHLEASSGRYTHIDGKGHRRVPFGSYKIGLIASGEEEKFLTNDVEHDPRVHDHEWAKSLGLVAFCGYRLKPLNGDVLGVFAMFARFPISPEMDAILEGLSRAISLAIQKDIVDRTLLESEQKFSALFEHSRDGIVIADTKTRQFVDSNRMFSHMLGYNSEEIKNLTIQDIHPEDSLPIVINAFEKMVRFEVDISENIPVKRKNRTIFYADITAYSITLFTKNYLVGVFRDITERKRVEEALKESNERYISYIKEAAMRLKTPVEIVERNLTTVIKDMDAGDLDKYEVLLQLHLQVKNMEQIRQNLLDLNKTIVDGYGKISPASKKFLTE